MASLLVTIVLTAGMSGYSAFLVAVNWRALRAASAARRASRAVA
jgi:hypothetical protein